ncbi:MAG: hypothetical protein M3Y57_15355 [Acidobacteriota bacterium]|nr:hypothetical protein [Acidobacteriota bacterium]
MVKTSLVSVDLERGREVLDALDNAGIRVSVVLWAYLSEYEDWRLIFADPRLDAIGVKKAYKSLNDTVMAAGMRIEDKPLFMVLSMSDAFIKNLRRSFGHTRSVDGMRLGGQLIGDRFVEDAYVYRIS